MYIFKLQTWFCCCCRTHRWRWSPSWFFPSLVRLCSGCAAVCATAVLCSTTYLWMAAATNPSWSSFSPPPFPHERPPKSLLPLRLPASPTPSPPPWSAWKILSWAEWWTSCRRTCSSSSLLPLFLLFWSSSFAVRSPWAISASWRLTSPSLAKPKSILPVKPELARTLVSSRRNHTPWTTSRGSTFRVRLPLSICACPPRRWWERRGEKSGRRLDRRSGRSETQRKWKKGGRKWSSKNQWSKGRKSRRAPAPAPAPVIRSAPATWRNPTTNTQPRQNGSKCHSEGNTFRWNHTCYENLYVLKIGIKSNKRQKAECLTERVCNSSTATQQVSLSRLKKKQNLYTFMRERKSCAIYKQCK